MHLKNTYVDGSPRSLRNFFMDLCDEMEKQEETVEELRGLENSIDMYYGAKDTIDELQDMMAIMSSDIDEKDKIIEEKDRIIKDLKNQLKDLQKVNRDLLAMTPLAKEKPVEKPVEPVNVAPKKKILKKKKRK